MKVSLHVGLDYIGSPYALGDCHLDAEGMESRAAAAGYNTELQTGIFSVSDFQIWANEHKRLGKKSDCTLFSMSSHGSQKETNEVGEFGYEEYLCFWSGKNIEVLSDDDFLRLLQQIPGSVFVVLDSCFSGGMSRFAKEAKGKGEWKSRFIPFQPDFEIVTPFAGRGFEQKLPASTNKLYFISASKEEEVSWSTGQGGLFTRYFCAHYDAHKKKSERTIKRLVAETLTNCAPDQHPNAKCYFGSITKTIF